MSENSNQVSKLIADSVIFYDLGPSQIQTLVKIAKVKHFPKSQEIFLEGQESNQIIILIKGIINIISNNKLLSVLKPIVLIGEMSLISNEKCSATAISDDKTTCITISKNHLLSVFKKNPTLEKKILKNIIRILNNKLKSSNDGIKNVMAQNKQLQFKIDDYQKKYPGSKDLINKINLEIQKKSRVPRVFKRIELNEKHNIMLVLDNFKDLGVIFDLSGGGFAAKNHQKYSLGEGEIITGKIIFNFEIPIDFVGQIKWANNEKFGCQFKGLSEKCQDQIQDYIRTGNFK